MKDPKADRATGAEGCLIRIIPDML